VATAAWGFFAAASLLLGAALALWRLWSTRTIGLVMAFGTGVLFSPVAFDLVEDALETGGGRPTTAGIALGAVVAAGAVLTMLASTMAPEAARGGRPR
jgi:zinc transporter, ZIP family